MLSEKLFGDKCVFLWSDVSQFSPIAPTRHNIFPANKSIENEYCDDNECGCNHT